jgi:DNA repair ATPase RecN
MKPTKLIIKNIGCIEDITLEITTTLVLFYGDIRQGKSTILNCIRWLFGANIPNDLIRHGEKEAYIRLDFSQGFVERSFYINKEGKQTARSIEAYLNNKKMSQTELTMLANPFLLDQDFFKNKTNTEKYRYFLEIFAIDTTEIDNKYFDVDKKAKELRSEIKGMGEINPVLIEQVDIESLNRQKQQIKDLLNKKYLENKNKNDELRKDFNSKKENAKQEYDLSYKDMNDKNALVSKAESYLQLLINIGYNGEEVFYWIQSLPKVKEVKLKEVEEPNYISELPDDSELIKIEEKITQASIINVHYEQYQKDLIKKSIKETKELELKMHEHTLRDLKKEKVLKLKTISDKIPGLTFDETGNFSYLDTSADMLSDSQLIELSSTLSALYPDGISIELIDRGESLNLASTNKANASIKKLIDYADQNKRNVLVTVVGDKPAKIEPEIGVFTVEQGKLLF